MPDEGRQRVVVVNATPIIALATIHQLALFRGLYGSVSIPTAVQKEVAAGGRARVGAAQLIEASWIHPVSLKDPRRADLLSDLDRGEAEVIALAQERNADLVVIDERLGRRHARRLDIPLTGTLGVLLKAKAEGIIPEVAPLVTSLRKSGMWLADDLVRRVLEIAGEDP